MSDTGQLAGETIEQYVNRLENELSEALLERDLAVNDGNMEANRLERLVKDEADTEQERDFLREQLVELEQQIRSSSAPSTRQQMARLIGGLLRGQDWRHGAWR